MSSNFSVIKDISYGNHERHKFDLFVPKNIENKTGIILFIHGGGWSDGDKSINYPESEFLSSNGFLCATMNYRFVTEEINVFSELDDISCCLKTIKEKCKEYGFDVKNAILSGGEHSLGKGETVSPRQKNKKDLWRMQCTKSLVSLK